MKKIVLFLIIVLSDRSHSLVGAGGYVPFGLSTQSDKVGGKGTFDFQSMLYLNTALPVAYLDLFLPELGVVFYHDLKDDYSKKTYYLLLDFGYQLRSNTLFRYGLGMFWTSIKGEGKAVRLNNGSGYSTFYTPSLSQTTHNVTWNLGVEQALNLNYALRFETYLFEVFSSLKRDVSYSLSFTYYL